MNSTTKRIEDLHMMITRDLLETLIKDILLNVTDLIKELLELV